MFQSAVIHAEYEFANHNAVINGVCYNRHQDCFVSTDDTCLRLWSAAKDELRRVELPARTTNFVQALEYIDSRQLYVAAALDGTLKMYDTNLNELASVFTGRGTILSLTFDTKHNRLLSGGVDGCAAWFVRGKPLGVTAENGINPHYELSPIPGFFTHAVATTSADSSGPSDNDGRDHIRTGSISDATAHLSPSKRTNEAGGSLAGASGRKKGGISGGSNDNGILPHQRPWVQNLQLNADRTRLYAQSKQCVDVFSAADGHHIETYSDLFPKEYGAIMAFVVHEKTHYLVCGCLNGWIFVVSLYPISVVHAFKDHTMSITGLVVHTSSNLILSSSLDGTVRLWDLEARRQAHRLDIGHSVQEIQLLVPHANPCRFYCRVRSAIHLFRIQSTIKEHLPALSPICILQRVQYPSHEPAAIVGKSEGGTRNLKNLGVASDEDSDESDGDQGDANEDDDDDDDDDDELGGDSNRKQVIVAAGMDKTIRLFTGRAANEAPSFTWIPEESCLDMIGFALNPVGKHLFLLLESQKIVVVDVSVHEKEESSILRTIDMGTQLHPGFGGGFSSMAPKPSSKSSISRDANGSRRNHINSNLPSTTNNNSNTNSSGWSPPRGGIKCVCVCYYPPMFRSAAPSASTTAHVTSAAQSKWFSRTFVNRQQLSSVTQGLKKVEEELAFEQSLSGAANGTSGGTPGHRRNALIQSEYEWIVCGSEFGHLLFWHTGLTNSGKEVVSIDAHDAGIIVVTTSTSSPLLVSLDEAKRVNLWYFQPVFMLCHMLDLSEKPSCFALSPKSELLLSGYDDGNVIFMDVSDPSAVVTHASDENHFAMVSAADFLDEKAIVLTASVDAMIKIWDQEKNLLRQVNIAMAFTSLCFMNAGGDVMAGLSNGIFIVTRDDVLPEKPPKQKRRKELKATVAAAKTMEANQKVDSPREPAPVAGGSVNEPSSHKLLADRKAPGVAGNVHNMSTSKVKVGEKAGRIEQKNSPPQQVHFAEDRSVTDARRNPASTPWKKPHQEGGDLTKWLTYVDRPLATLEYAPVLRPVNKPRGQPENSDAMKDLRTMNQRIPSRHQRKKESYSQMLPLISADSKEEEDWREQLMPSTPYRLLSAAEAAAASQRHSRRKSQLLSSPMVLQTLNQSPRSRSPQKALSVSPMENSNNNGSVGTPCSPEMAMGLGIGASIAASPLQYCKHQAPVPPKKKTPRKLWNAIGGEDRRLIVLQRNVQQF